MTTHDYYDGFYDDAERVESASQRRAFEARSRQHRTASQTKRPIAPIAIGTLAVVVIGVLAIDGLRGGGSPGSGATPPAAVENSSDAQSPAAEVAAVAAVATTVPAEAIDLEGCQLSVQSVQAGDSGEGVECVQKAMTVMGFYDGPIDGVFSDQLTASAIAFQTALGLYKDGIVGRRTAEQLGIWPGDDSFVVHTPAPAPGTYDLLGFELSSVASKGTDAPPLPDNAGQGTGKRVVYSRLGQRVWAIDDNEQIVRSYLVSGSQYNNEVAGTHKVYSKSEMTTGWNGQADLPLMVRWLDTERGAIGFHQIPFHKSDGSVYQSEAELGQRLSGGCQRQAPLDAKFMWAFADIGTPVIVL